MCISFCQALLTPHLILATTMTGGAAGRIWARDMEMSFRTAMNKKCRRAVPLVPAQNSSHTHEGDQLG